MEKIEYTKMFDREDTHFWFLGKRYFVDSVLSKYRSKLHKILDLGSGTGGMTKHLEKYGDVIGVEKYNYARALAKKRGVNVTRGSVEHLKFASNRFDLVTIFDVLYHKNVISEKQVIKEAYRVLKKKGYLLITDSAMNMLTSYHDIVTQGKKRYSVREMLTIVKSQNFKILKASYIFFTIFPLVAFERLIINRFTKRKVSDVKPVSFLVNIILLNLLKVESWFLQYMSLPIGSSVIILAVKK